MRFPNFIYGSHESQSPISDQERTMNWYTEIMESPGATAKAALYPTPGVETFLMVADISCRCMFSQNGRCFGVYGTGFYEFFSGGTATKHGTVAIDDNPATIVSNGDGGQQLFITSGDVGYCFDLTTDTLTTELASGATMGGMLYGYFVSFNVADSSFRISDLFDGTTWDPTQTAENSISPDNWSAMYVTPYGQIALLGSQSGQFWYNSGAFPFPFAPDPSGLIEEGIAATFSIQQAGKSTVWLSTNKNGGYQVMRAIGFDPQAISTYALDFAISRYERVDDAIGQTYEDQGHAFYILTFPHVRKTWCYDFETNQWHERGTWISEDDEYNYWRPVYHCFFDNKHLVGDRESGFLYHMDIAFPLDVESRPIRRLRRSPALVSQNERLNFPYFELLFENGLGVDGDPTTAPIVMMRVSNDGGRTWSMERQATTGAQGDFDVRTNWWNTGMGRKRVFEITCTDAVNAWRLTDAYVKVEPMYEAA